MKIQKSFNEYQERKSYISPGGIVLIFVLVLILIAAVLTQTNIPLFAKRYQPTIQQLTSSLSKSILQKTNGSVVFKHGEAIWSQKNTALYATPSSQQEIAHIQKNFPLTTLGDNGQSNGSLWYHVQWATPDTHYTGWIPAEAVTNKTPATRTAWASFDALSPSLGHYLASLGPTTGAVVYDLTHNHYYTYNNHQGFIVASSMKVPIMLTFLHQLEEEHTEPNDDQMNILSTMIENSNNDSASELYYNEINGSGEGISKFMQQIGIMDFHPDATAWGYSLITSQAMVNLLTRLYQGTILTEADRALAFNLMENVETDQQIGVGNTAPPGATVALKDGWVTGPDNLWAMNSSGIVMTKKETYIIAVYSQEQQTLHSGQEIAQKVSGDVAHLLS